MVTTVRLDGHLRARLRQAARASSRTESDLIREAIAERCDAVLADAARDPLADLIGSVRGERPDYGERAHEAFGEALLEDARRKEQRRRRGR